MFAANPSQNNFMTTNPLAANPLAANPMGGNPMGMNPMVPTNPMGMAPTNPIGMVPTNPMGMSPMAPVNPMAPANPMAPRPTGVQPAPYVQPGMINLGDQQVPAVWGEQLKQAIDGFHQLEWDIALQNMLKLIGIEQDRSEEVMEKAMSADFSQKNWDTQKGKEQVEYVRERCGKIRTKNLALMVRMMNLREKMVSQMYMYKSPSKPRALELSQMNEKIRDYKYQISLKHNQLKVLKLNRELDQEAEPKRPPLVVNVPLVELKKGTEVLEKETLRLREEFSLLQRYIHGETIL